MQYMTSPTPDKSTIKTSPNFHHVGRIQMLLLQRFMSSCCNSRFTVFGGKYLMFNFNMVDLTKQLSAVCISFRQKKTTITTSFTDNCNIRKCPSSCHLGMTQNGRTSFEHCLWCCAMAAQGAIFKWYHQQKPIPPIWLQLHIMMADLKLPKNNKCTG